MVKILIIDDEASAGIFKNIDRKTHFCRNRNRCIVLRQKMHWKILQTFNPTLCNAGHRNAQLMD